MAASSVCVLNYHGGGNKEHDEAIQIFIPMVSRLVVGHGLFVCLFRSSYIHSERSRGCNSPVPYITDGSVVRGTIANIRRGAPYRQSDFDSVFEPNVGLL